MLKDAMKSSAIVVLLLYYSSLEFQIDALTLYFLA